jgi:hypothetical protein
MQGSFNVVDTTAVLPRQMSSSARPVDLVDTVVEELDTVVEELDTVVEELDCCQGADRY